MKRYITSGVRKSSGGYSIDYTYNAPDDLIHIEEPQLYSSIHNNDIYYFGYRFNDNADSKLRTEFIRSVKQIGDSPLTDDELIQFIKRPLGYLNNFVNLYHIDCLVYPLSQRSTLVSKIIRCINDMTSHDMDRCSFELVKQAPTNIGFDFKSFESDYSASPGYNQMVKHIKDTLLPAINRLDYFSIAQNVKSKYRPYITGFLNFNDPADIEKFSELQGKNILVVDDINTTGSTMHEILRILGQLNDSCNIFVYTLIGK